MLFCAMNIFSSRYFHILYPHASDKREYIFVFNFFLVIHIMDIKI